MGRWTRRAMIGGLGASGVLAACSARLTDFDEIIEAKFPAIGQFVDAGGTKIHYDKRGSGPAVVLIHGASGNLRDFTFSMSDALAAQGFTAIALDRPGHGYSERRLSHDFSPSAHAEVLREATAALGIERPIIVGHSYGGAVAAAWTVDAPNSISGAAILAGVTYPWPAGDNAYHAAAATAVFGPPVNAIVRNRVLNKGTKSAVRWVFKPQSPPAGYTEYIGAELASRPATFRQNGRDITNLNKAMSKLSTQYSSIAVPVELIHGTADAIVPVDAHAKRFKAANPSVTLSVLPGVGHMVHQVAQDEVIEAVKRLAGREA